MACFFKRYKVDYCGEKYSYKGAKDSYRAGKTVVLRYWMVATDTDYRFFVDGAPADVGWSDKGGYIIRFKMPAHDVTVRCESRNTMLPEQFRTDDQAQG